MQLLVFTSVTITNVFVNIQRHEHTTIASGFDVLSQPKSVLWEWLKEAMPRQEKDVITMRQKRSLMIGLPPTYF